MNKIIVDRIKENLQILECELKDDKSNKNDLSLFQFLIKEVFEELGQLANSKFNEDTLISLTEKASKISAAIDVLQLQAADINEKLNPCTNPNEKEEIKVFAKGINNIGNSCYINSVLQLLQHTKYFIGNFNEDNNGKNSNASKLKEVLSSVLQALSSKDSSPKSVAETVKIFREKLFSLGIDEFKKNEIGEQNDAGALLELLLEDFACDMTTTRACPIPDVKQKESVNKEGICFKLPLPQGGLSVENELQNLLYSQQETDLKFSLLDIRMTMPIWNEIRTFFKPPSFFALQLQRFSKDQQNKWQKNSKPIHFRNDKFGTPLKLNDPEGDRLILDVGSNDKKQKTEYFVQGFIVHHGDHMNSGHYTCCAKVGNEWYHFDDSTVTKLDAEQLEQLQQKAYIYMLVKKEG